MAEPKTRAEVIAISNAVADDFRIPRVLLLACGIAEGNLVWNVRRPTNPSQDAAYWPDVSGGPWQQTILYDPDYQGGSAYPGPAEVARVLELQYDVKRAAQVAAANLSRKFRDGTETDDDENLIRDLFEYNWPGGHERPYTPEHEANYRRGLKEARAILGVTPMVTYNASEPAHPQDKSFDCSQEAAEWALWSVGRKPADGWMEATMIAEGVMSAANGLEDASGAGLAAFLNRQYGEFGYVSTNDPAVSFDDLAQASGRRPLMIGGRAWGHWSGLRGYEATRDLLLLANPADGWKDVFQTMDRDQFAALGPFSMVELTHPDLEVSSPPPPPADPRDARIAELEAQIADKDRRLMEVVNMLGYARGDVAGAIESAVNTLRGLVPTP